MPSHSATIERVRAALNDSFDAIFPWFDRPAEVRVYKPSDGGWSINQILEHITLTTHFLLIIVRKGYPKALKRAQTQPLEYSESDLEMLIPIGRRDAFPWIRPEHMEPVGRSADEVLLTMRQQKAECLEVLAKIGSGEGSLYKVRMSVNNSGRIDLYQWFFFIAQHAKRHIGQMEECLEEWREHQRSA